MNNLELSYERISVTGFPGIWHIIVKGPKLKLVSNSDPKEITIKEIECIFDLSFKIASLVIKNKIIQEQDFGLEKTYYYLSSEKPIVAILKFSKPFYRLSGDSNIASAIKVFRLNNLNLSASFQNEQIFNIHNLAVSLNQTSSEIQQDIALKVQGSYHGQNYLLGFNSAHLNLDSIFTNTRAAVGVDVSSHKIYKVNSFELDIDEDSKVNLMGSLEIYSDRLPEGHFFVSLNNYSKVIDKLVHPNFVIPKTTLKQIVAGEGKGEIKAQANIDGKERDKGTQTAFEIKLSQTGITIGSVNLFDINKNNPDIDNEIEY